MQQSKVGRKALTAARKAERPRLVAPKLAVHTERQMMHNAAPPLPTAEGPSDHVDYQLWNIGATISMCRAEWNTLKSMLNREQQARISLQQTVTQTQQELSLANSRHANLYNQYYALRKQCENMQSTQKLESIQVHSELAAAKDLVNKQNEHINAYKTEINRIQLKLDEQSHVVQSQDNVINELRLQPFRSPDETSLGKELEFLLKSPQPEASSENRSKRKGGNTERGHTNKRAKTN